MTTKNELLKRVRLNYFECMGWGGEGNQIPFSDVEGCTSQKCQFFDFRFGIDPRPNETLSRIAKERWTKSIDGYVLPPQDQRTHQG